MKQFLFTNTKILLPLLTLLSIAFCACKKEEEEDMQRKRIEDFLRNNNYDNAQVDGIYFVSLQQRCGNAIEITSATVEVPRDSLVEIVCDETTSVCDTTYTNNDTSIIVYDTTQYSNSCEYLAVGDRVTIAFIATVFGGAVFATTDDDVATQNNIYPMSPPTIELGAGQIISGVERALLRMTVGEDAQVFFPFTLGYGEEKNVGLVPSRAPQMWTIRVISKQ